MFKLPKTCPVCKSNDIRFKNGWLAVCGNCKAYREELSFDQRVSHWTLEKDWWWRVPILLWFLYMFGKSVHNPAYSGTRTNPFSAFDLGIHELGHVIFSTSGQFMHILGGSLFQVLFPIIWLVALAQRKAYFAASMCLCWTGYNLYDVSVYAADARARLLPLTGGFGNIGLEDSPENYDRSHDWYQILSRTHHLNSDLTIAYTFRLLGTFLFLLGLTIGAFLIVMMFINSRKQEA
jgi:hypothetical protein